MGTTQPKLYANGGFDVEHKIDPDLFTDSCTALNEAVDRAVKLSVKWGKPDKGFIQELKRNNAVFAAFKAHREQNDLAGLLVDDDGNARSFDSFRWAAAPVIGEYNVNWLQTEYATAVRVARTAVRFKQYEKDGDLYPNAEWLPSRAAEPRMSHRKYYHTVRRLTDPWWETHYPVSTKADQTEARENVRAAKAILDTYPDTNIKIREHVRAYGVKNPEYEIDDLIADRKGIESPNGVASGFNKAIKQGCSVVVLDLDMHPDKFRQLPSIKLSSAINNRHLDFKNGTISECYVIYNDKAVKITPDFFSGDTRQTKERIRAELEKIKGDRSHL